VKKRIASTATHSRTFGFLSSCTPHPISTLTTKKKEKNAMRMPEIRKNGMDKGVRRKGERLMTRRVRQQEAV
jgi:hypothetical protein